MAIVMDTDGFLLSFNNTFLISLQRERYILSNIRFKFITEGRPVMYRTFKTYEEFYDYYAATLTDRKLYCLTGRYLVLESINLVNEKLNFPNSYWVRTIPTNIQVQKNFKLDNYRNKFNTRNVEKYDKYLYRKFTNYMKDINSVTTYRKTKYIDSCWIDPDYFRSDILGLLTV